MSQVTRYLCYCQVLSLTTERKAFTNKQTKAGKPAKKSTMTIPEAIAQIDIQELFDEYFPNNRQGNRVICTWRGGKRLSGYFSKTRKKRLCDPVSQKMYDAYDFLIEIVGLSPQAATREILRRTQSTPIKQNKKIRFKNLNYNVIISNHRLTTEFYNFILQNLKKFKISQPKNMNLQTWKHKTLQQILKDMED